MSKLPRHRRHLHAHAGTLKVPDKAGHESERSPGSARPQRRRRFDRVERCCIERGNLFALRFDRWWPYPRHSGNGPRETAETPHAGRRIGAGKPTSCATTALLLTLFAGLAMTLAAIGIYGLLSYWVNVREPEIAIRLALGARPSEMLRWASFHALRLAVMGIGFGVTGGWAAARGLEDLVFGIPTRDPATMLAAALAVAAVALAATAIPAWRAAGVDAARRLHHA